MNENDVDCDLVLLDVDSNNEDSSVTNTKKKDADCDGLNSDYDADDTDGVPLHSEHDSNNDGIVDVDILSSGGSHSCALDSTGTI
jgi:hypothetical protein